MNEWVNLSKHDGIGVLTITNPPVNALSKGVLEGISHGLNEIAADKYLQCCVLVGEGVNFVAGADINDLLKMSSRAKPVSDEVGSLIGCVENFLKPIIAAINGMALGGGLELGMAAHYRVAAPNARFGQPEVKLGIIPGAGGTQRLPRLAGLARALDLCSEGTIIDAKEALKIGLIDQIIEKGLLEGATAFARSVASIPPRRTCDLPPPQANDAVVGAARDTARKKQRGQSAPLAAIDAVEASTRLCFADGCKEERRLFENCLLSSQARALIHVFFAEREVSKIPDIPKESVGRPIRSAAIVGAGTMGVGISMALANAGIPVLLKDMDQAAIDRALNSIQANYLASVKRGRLTENLMQERLGLIRPTLSYDSFARADLVIEAAFEGMDVKQKIFREIDGFCNPGAILATNTSTLNIDEIAQCTGRPESVIGLHFFSPANVMRLVEIVRGAATSVEAIVTSMQVAKALKKVGVLVRNSFGFVGNRMFLPYIQEAQFMVEEGALPEVVDGALYDFGMAMGPLATGDLAGLDVAWRIRQDIRGSIPAGTRRPFAEDRLCELGRFGQKTGAGWYRYNGDRKPMPDPTVVDLVRKEALRCGIAQRNIASEEIVERCILMLVNEGARVLEQGIALRSGDIDTIYVNGYGFPVYKGGPMCYADERGLNEIYHRIREFHAQHGQLWEPAPLLKRLAEQGSKFADFESAAARV